MPVRPPAPPDTEHAPSPELGAHAAALLSRLDDAVALLEVLFDDSGQPSDYRILDVNPAFSSLTGYPRERVVGRLASGANAADATLIGRYGAVVTRGVPDAHETYYAPLDRHFRVAMVPLGGAQVAGVFHDITDRVLHETALARSEADLRRSQRVARLGSYHMDVQARRWTCTRQLDELFGTTSAPVHELSEWIELLHPEDREATTRYFFDEVLGQRRPFDREYRLVRADDGRTVWVHGLGELEVADDGTVLRMFGTIQDVSERHQAEDERRQLEQRLRHADKVESLAALAGGVAHDFNNLLTTVLGNAQLARRALATGGDPRAHLDDIERASRRAAELARQMLAYAGKSQVRLQPLSVNALVTALPGVASERPAVAYRLRPDLPLVDGDATALGQVVRNLVTNAREAIAERGGTITVATDLVDCDPGSARGLAAGGEPLAPGRYVQLEVADDGPGMDDATRARIFDPFFTTKFTGRGLGLAVVHGIVRGHRGGLELDTAPGQGARFRVLLPVDSAPPLDPPE